MLSGFRGCELSRGDAVESAAEQAELAADVALLRCITAERPCVLHHIGGVTLGLEQGQEAQELVLAPRGGDGASGVREKSTARKPLDEVVQEGRGEEVVCLVHHDHIPGDGSETCGLAVRVLAIGAITLRSTFQSIVCGS